MMDAKQKDIYLKNIGKQIVGLKKATHDYFELNHRLDINLIEKILKIYFTEDFFPTWYFYSNTAEEIADHILIISQFLNSNIEYLALESKDGKAITYFLNVGRDFPGRLVQIIRENKDMDIVSYDSVKTSSGIRIITIEKEGRTKIGLSKEELAEIDLIEEELRLIGRTNNYKHTDDFLKTLSSNYWSEELKNLIYPRRVIRHQRVYEEVINSKDRFIMLEDTTRELDNEKIDTSEKRITVGVKNPNSDLILKVLEQFKENNINMNRSYLDTFAHRDLCDIVAIVSVYMGKHIDLSETIRLLTDVELNPLSNKAKQNKDIEKRIEFIVRKLSSKDLSSEELDKCINELKALICVNTDINNSDEIKNLLLNIYSDFIEAARFLGIENNHNILRLLLGFEAFDEFFVIGKTGNTTSNKPGFRIKHNLIRGKAFKGGLRIDPTVNFTEVAALSFLMTWKCARSKILYGGAKGGLMLNPKDFNNNKIDFFDTLANFGQALFLVTGPAKDVPAGDVGCGPEEISTLVEGFKSALRDLVLMVYGIKRAPISIGNKIITIEHARKILSDNFNIDVKNETFLKELTTSEKYLELVVAAQITGKPNMGIAARKGATGRGLCYSILAAVTRKYLDGEWCIEDKLIDQENALLKKVARINEAEILRKQGEELINKTEWDLLNKNIYRKLLENKKVIVQGSGKVGGSILSELSKYRVNVVAVSDAGGAVIGDHLDVEDLLQAVENSRSHSDKFKRSTMIGANKNVYERIYGAEEGSVILERECDILVLAALENAITAKNAGNVKAKIIVCGSNGPNTSKAEIILSRRRKIVLYDFLANQSGVIASYFEWLRNWVTRFRYEAEVIERKEFKLDMMDQYCMPEFRERIKKILLTEESIQTTHEWNMILRDIMFAAINDDYDFAKKYNVSMKTAGLVNAQLRVLTAMLLKMSREKRIEYWNLFSEKIKELIQPFFLHPEAKLYRENVNDIVDDMVLLIKDTELSPPFSIN
jgi:glutamate dehydrogenase/leucine dehydrogenase